MIRKTLIGLAAVAAVAAAAASTASAGYYGYSSYYGGYQPHYSCHKVIVGYKTIWNGYGWIQVPRFKRVCNYY